jgi:hypothetical protein
MTIESLGDKQKRFAKLVPRLIDKAHELGFEVTLGDAYRDPRVHGALGVKIGYGHPKSAHKQKLAIDLNLFKGGKFLALSEDHKPLGEWWEQQAPDARWGGRFNDGNHYSLEHEGIK